MYRLGRADPTTGRDCIWAGAGRPPRMSRGRFVTNRSAFGTEPYGSTSPLRLRNGVSYDLAKRLTARPSRWTPLGCCADRDGGQKENEAKEKEIAGGGDEEKKGRDAHGRPGRGTAPDGAVRSLRGTAQGARVRPIYISLAAVRRSARVDIQ
ncbi:hypothetical protein EVAR_60055_1 [Eumeta japonica]|uniref:Uncharacterized protein n=1 Tax=Eumeta variegata TaxID=151549 RepID=A0A4C1ZLG1_EUMVA|nr:hypothetical protein EVAR_60055_1 [Eumeta japonica]